jgi:peptidoglycan/xylan/chitin deacetylase (PgdA/CDA1 family)
VRIEGTAPPGAAVFLFGAGGYVASAPVAVGRFRFEGVRDRGPYRVGLLPLSAETAAPEAALAAAAEPAREAAPAPGRRDLAPSASDVSSPAPAAPPLAARPPSPAAGASSPATRPLPSDTLLVPDMTRGPSDRPELVLSFDAGSTSRGARQILDALRARGIRTTIFLTGDFIRRHPDLARQIASDGHEVGNHTDTHPHLTTYAEDGRQATRPGVDRRFLARQLASTAEAWRAATGLPMAPLWRAPYGEQNGQIRGWAAMEGYWHVGWTGGRAGLDGLDWVTDPSSRAYRTAGGVVGRLVSRAENGGIILLHLGSDREDPVAPRVPELLDALSARGFRFARASDFLDRLGMTGERLSILASRGRSTPP